MKKNFLSFATLMLGIALTFSACSDDDNNGPDTETPADLDYSAENADAWGNYMYNVASLLKNDAANLYKYWNEDYKGTGPYAEAFKKHNIGGETSIKTALNGIEQIFDKCAEIANEVGSAKIGDPLDKYNSGDKEGALYAVESWYSWHSRDDYTNNIWSIRNSYYGTVSSNDTNDQNDIQTSSIYKLVEAMDADMNKQLDDAIHAAADAIQNIPQPFRNNINSDEALAAQDACLSLENTLKEVKAAVRAAYENTPNDSKLEAILVQYTDYVVLPTYKSLMEKNAALFEAAKQFKNSPSNSNFDAASEAWLVAREPWEKSEGFLFGPVDTENLDPNMDSWPLDQNIIASILKSGNFDKIEWDEDDDSADIEAAQNVRGYHTLEYLLFKDGKPRKVNN